MLDWKKREGAKPIMLKNISHIKLNIVIVFTMTMFFSCKNNFEDTLYDDANKKNLIVSDYAIVYAETDLIDLQGNVVLTTHDGDILNAEQLYYDQLNDWLFTNEPVKFTTKDQIINGNGFDSNMDFTKAKVLEITGIVYLEE